MHFKFTYIALFAMLTRLGEQRGLHRGPVDQSPRMVPSVGETARRIGRTVEAGYTAFGLPTEISKPTRVVSFATSQENTNLRSAALVSTIVASRRTEH
jgi:hypothetical protein